MIIYLFIEQCIQQHIERLYGIVLGICSVLCSSSVVVLYVYWYGELINKVTGSDKTEGRGTICIQLSVLVCLSVPPSSSPLFLATCRDLSYPKHRNQLKHFHRHKSQPPTCQTHQGALCSGNRVSMFLTVRSTVQRMLLCVCVCEHRLQQCDYKWAHTVNIRSQNNAFLIF